MAQHHHGRDQQEEGDNNGRKPRTDRQARKGSALTGGLEVLATIAITQPAPEVPQTLLEVAQGMQACTSFGVFAYEGQGATLFLAEAGLIFEHKGETLVVIKAEDQRLVGVFIWFSELRQLAEAGKTIYRPRADSKCSEDLENKRAYVLSSLLQTIEAEGGHEGVMTVIDALGYAKYIRDQVAAGSQDLLMMFDQGGTHTFFVEVNSKPLEFRSGHLSVPGWQHQKKVMREVFGVKLRSAPLGTPNGAYKEGDYVVLQHLFSKTPPAASVAAMMEDIISLFESAGKLDEAKAAVIDIGGVIPGALETGDGQAVVLPQATSVPVAAPGTLQ